MLHTLSSLFCQLSSLFTMRSMQWDRVARIPAVVALNVMASPLKSMPLGLKAWNTAHRRIMGIKRHICTVQGRIPTSYFTFIGIAFKKITILANIGIYYNLQEHNRFKRCYYIFCQLLLTRTYLSKQLWFVSSNIFCIVFFCLCRLNK